MRVRQLRTLRETFLEMKLSPDGRIRTSYGLTETGRLSSSEDLFGVGANLQNIPKRKGKWIRAMFVPDDGKILFKADGKQAEAVVVAYRSKDPNYKRIIKSSDVHKSYAALLFDKEFKNVTDKERERAKKFRHARNYGMGPILLGLELGISRSEAEQLIFLDNQAFPNIEGYFWKKAPAIDKNIVI